MSTLIEQIDLLVDGEMDEQQKTQLLKSLDYEPDGWKRCALGFLESQTIRSVLTGAFATERDRPAALSVQEPKFEPGERSRSVPFVVVQAKEARFVITGRNILALTICLFFGFFAGLALRNSPLVSPDSAEPIARQGIAPEAATVSLQTIPANTPVQQPTPLPFDVAYRNPGAISGDLAPQKRLISFVSGSPPEPEEMYLPCFDHTSMDSDLIQKLYKDTSKNTRDRLGNYGVKVDFHRDFHVFRGDDDELILVPSQSAIVSFAAEEQFE